MAFAPFKGTNLDGNGTRLHAFDVPARGVGTKYPEVLTWFVLAAITAPSGAAAQEACTRRASSSNEAAITGYVTDRLGYAVANATVTAGWLGWERADGNLVERPRTASVRSGPDGRYLLCGVPTRVQLAVHAQYGNNASRRTLLSLRDTSQVPLNLTVGFGLAATDAASSVHLRSLSGTVFDSDGAPLMGARLTLEGLDAAALSGETGVFDFGLLTPGRYSVRVRRIGYRSQSVLVNLVDSVPTVLDFRLAAVPVELSSVVTVANRSAFERESGFGERRRRGTGVFFDRHEIEARGPQKLTDLLRAVSGLRVETRLTRWGYQTTPTLDRSASGSVGCPMDFYVNGHEYTPTTMGIDNDIPAGQIEAIEVYKPSQIPAQFFGRRSRCGAVVIWTRYRAHEVER